MNELFEGRCLCGDIRFTAAGKPKWVLWCHCESCRRHSGAPASVFVSFSDEAISLTQGVIAKYVSSPGVERGFCARCGSTLTCSNKKLPNETHFHIGAFERAADLAPTGAFFAEERLPWSEQGSGALGGLSALAQVALKRDQKSAATRQSAQSPSS